jgi:organic hydroperoxide reductase OsmC/OhrA
MAPRDSHLHERNHHGHPLHREALATGGGRNGHVRTTDGILDFDVRVPKEMGGAGEAPNPSCCSPPGTRPASTAPAERRPRPEGEHRGLERRLARRHRPERPGGFQLAVELEVNIPDVDLAVAQQLADAAHQVCPYSNATRGNIEVSVTVVDD